MPIGKASRTGGIGRPARSTGSVGKSRARHGKKDVDLSTQKVYPGYAYPTTTTTTVTTTTVTTTTAAPTTTTTA